MPRAFLITSRRYVLQDPSHENSEEKNGSIENPDQENEFHITDFNSENYENSVDYSPERTPSPVDDTSPDSNASSSECVDEPPGKAASPHSPANLYRIPYYKDEPQEEPLGLVVEKKSDLTSSSYVPELHFRILQEADQYLCPDCGKQYSTSSNLARHRQTHRSISDRKARKCPHCDKVYVSLPAFSMHVRTHNQGCQCPYCGKCFSRPWLLQGHIRTHTGEKPFKCNVCNKAFADKSNLRAHVQTHSTTKPYVCQRCGKAFALKSYLYKHEESSCMRLHRQPFLPESSCTLSPPSSIEMN